MYIYFYHHHPSSTDETSLIHFCCKKAKNENKNKRKKIVKKEKKKTIKSCAMLKSFMNKFFVFLLRIFCYFYCFFLLIYFSHTKAAAKQNKNVIFCLLFTFLSFSKCWKNKRSTRKGYRSNFKFATEFINLKTIAFP